MKALKMLWVFILVVTVGYCGKGEVAGVVYKIPTSARVEALGGCSALIEDPCGIAYNPAVVSQLKRSFTFSYVDNVVDSYLSYIGGSFEVKEFNVGVSVGYLDGGKFKHYIPEQDSPKDEFKASSDFYLLLCGGKKLSNLPLSIGGALKYLSSRLAKDYSASSIAVDIGVIYEFKMPKVKLSGVLQNLGSGLKYYKDSNSLPTLIRCSVGVQVVPNLAVVVEVKNTFTEGITSGLGIEYLLFQMLYLRGGYRFGDEAKGISCGFGIKFRNINLDYAYAPVADLQSEHRMSFNLNF